MSRRNKVFGAIRWAAAATVVRALLQFGQVVLLARYLSKEDMGLAVLLFSFVAFVQVFSDFGLSNIILHRSDLCDEDLASILGFSFFLGACLFLLSCALGPFVSDFYNDDRLLYLIGGVGSVFLLNSLWMQRKTIAEKAFLFDKVGIAEVLSGVTSFAVMSVVVVNTKSVYGVLIGPVGYSLCMCIILPIFVGASSSMRFSISRLKPYIGYSLYNLGFSVTNSLSSQTDVFFGSHLIGHSGMGGYGVSKDLGLKISMVVNNTVTRVAAPLIADSREDISDLKRVYGRILALTTFVNFPIYMAIAVFSSDYIDVLFGSRWNDEWLVFSLLSMWGLVRSIGNPCGSLLFVLGHTRLAFVFSLVSAIFFVPGYFFGAHFGSVGLALAMLLLMLAQQIYPIWKYIVGPLTGMRYRDYIYCLSRPLASAGLAWGGCFIFWHGHGFLAFVLSQILACLAYICFSYVLNRESLLDFLRFFGLAR